MKKSFLQLRQWASAHPVKACLWSALLGILATWQGSRASLDYYDLIPWLILLIGLILTIWISSFKWLVILLTATHLLLPVQPKAAEKPQGGAVIAGVIVVVVGGIVIFKVVQFCQTHFP